ncbi:hypothetical protein L9F63_016719, partial [Diploptera punctata]
FSFCLFPKSLLGRRPRWFCHFDDDNYVNVPRLVNLLADYSPQEDWYLGKPSIRAPLEILNRDNTALTFVSVRFVTNTPAQRLNKGTIMGTRFN